jgi:hypothetical protein
MRRVLISTLVAIGAAAALSVAALWPRAPAQAQIGLPAAAAECSCSRGAALEAGPSRVFVHVCQCGALQCVISAGTTPQSNTAPQLAQFCR